MKKTIFWCMVILLSLVITSRALQADEKKENAAADAVKAWLATVDDGKYAESWDQAAGYFKGAIKKDDWAGKLKAVRTPLGKVLSRKVTSKSLSRSLPGAPDGEYVVVKLDTSFEKKKASVETVSAVLEKDGKWRVTGYFIQ